MYESGYSVRIYQILENDLVDFLCYIPIDYYLGEKKKNIFSPKLAELLIRIGSQIDTFFRNWVIVHEVYNGNNKKPLKSVYDLRYPDFKNIETYGKVILSDKEIKIIATDEIIIPFVNWTNKCYPRWWDAYTKVKHNGFIYNKNGSLLNVIESLAALFLLNCIHEKTKNKLAEYGFIDIRNRELFEMLDCNMEKYYPHAYITSKIFEFKKK